MQERDCHTTRSTSRNHQFVTFDIVKHPDADKTPAVRYKGVRWKKNPRDYAYGGCWVANVEMGKKIGRVRVKMSVDPVVCAMAYDDYIIDNNVIRKHKPYVRRTTNYDLYGEYWK